MYNILILYVHIYIEKSLVHNMLGVFFLIRDGLRGARHAPRNAPLLRPGTTGAIHPAYCNVFDVFPRLAKYDVDF